ncbi:hypothetical protein ABPG73_022283 [Tetrahymena malaccensis]
MDVSFESVNKSKTQKQKSIFSQHSKHLEEDNNDCQQSYNDKIDRSCQRYLFEIKRQQLEQGHQGDQDVSDTSSFDGYNVSIQDIKGQETIRQLQTELPISEKRNSGGEIFPCSLTNSKRINSKVDMSSNYGSQQIIKNKEDGEIDPQEISFFRENIENQEATNTKCNSMQLQQNQQNISINKNIQIDPSKQKINGKCSRDKSQSIKQLMKNEGQIQIHEKRVDNLNRATTNAVNKGQQKAIMAEQKYEQNFQKGTNIISKLLNNSMNRIIRIKQHVQNFVNLLKQRVPHKKITNLTLKDYSVINDLCFFYKKNQKKKQNNFLQKRLYLIFKCTQSIPIFMPTDTIRVIWDVFQVIFTYIFLYFYSILMFFNQDSPDSDFIQKFFFYAFFLFLVDILINFNTAYFDKDTIVQKRKLIAKQYIFSTLFITDCTSLLVQGLQVIQKHSSIVYNPNHDLLVYGFNMLLFLKINGISPKQKRFYYVFTLKDSQKHIIKLINQLISVMTVAHVAAICWYFIGIQEIVNNYPTNWLDKIGISQQHYYEKYIYSIYWSITTMTTAQEQKDRDKESEDQILSILSNKLRDEITIEINSRILNSYHIFTSNFSHTTLKKLVFRMQEVLVSPNEVIFTDEQYDDLSIYFIQNGVIEIYQQSVIKQGQTTVIQKLSENQLFGEISFFSGLSRKASARSTNLSTLYKITREDFLEVLSENYEDYQKFKMMQEQIIFQNELSIMYTECYQCRQIGHIAKTCPKTHQQFDRQFIVLKNNISFFQERSTNLRSLKRSKLNSTSQLRKNIEYCQILKENLENLNTEIYFMFNTEENLNSSEFTSSESEEEEEIYKEDESMAQSQKTDKKSESQSQSYIFTKKKTYKGDKNNPQQLNANNFFNENDQNQEINHNNKPNTQNRLQQDTNKKKIQYSQNKLTSIELKESQTNNLVSEYSNSNLTSNNYTQQEKEQQLPSMRGSEYLNQNIIEIQQVQNNENLEQNTYSPGQSKNLKNQIQKKRRVSSNYLYQFNINKTANKAADENSLENKNQDFQKQPTLQEKMSQAINQYQQSYNNSKRLLSQNSTKTINFDNNEYRCSIDQMLLQGMIANTVLQAHRQSLMQKKYSAPQNIIQEIIERNQNSRSRNEFCEGENNPNKKIGSSKSITDHREEKSFNNLSNLNPVSMNNSSNINSNNQNNNNNNGSSNNNTSNIKKLNENNQMIEDMQFVERISRLMQTNQLPMLFQYTSGLSLKELQTMGNSNSMDFFDKMCNFKKFFPKNNFEKVINKLRFLQQEQKRNKKKRLSQKSRRQNFIFPANQPVTSNRNIHSGKLKSDHYAEQYKPTNLSYGVGTRNGVVFPKNKFQIE